jgi:hypothetical protein
MKKKKLKIKKELKRCITKPEKRDIKTLFLNAQIIIKWK